MNAIQALPFSINPSKRKPTASKLFIKSSQSILITWALVLSLMAIAQHVNNIFFSFFCCLLMGGAQQRFFTIYHEAFHSNLYANKRLNNSAAKYLACYPSLSTFYSAKRRHLAHHARTATDFDPERVSHIRSVFEFASLAFPWIAFPRLLISKITRRPKSSGMSCSENSNQLTMTFALEEIPPLLAFNLILLVVLANAFPHSWWIYYGSLVTFYGLLSMIRSWVEHFNYDQTASPAYRVNIYPNIVEKYFFSPMSFNMHLLHHSNPSIPSFQLAEITNDYKNEFSSIEIRRNSYISTFYRHFILHSFRNA